MIRGNAVPTPLRSSWNWKATSASAPIGGCLERGQITTTDVNGARETVQANDLFYWPPMHNVKVDADAEIIMFSPQREHSLVIKHMIEKVKG